MTRKIRIAIDGPAGAGKSSVAQDVAKALEYVYIDTGAMYRAVACLALRQKLTITTNEAAISAIAAQADIDFRQVAGAQRIFVNGEDLEEKVRLPEIGALSSPVSAIASVRENLLQKQRNLAAVSGVVMEGRDIGTVVLPNAELKIFLTATPEERARRRFEQISAQNPDLCFEQVLADQIERDARDSSREVAPLTKASDAIEIVSDGMTQRQVVERIVELATAKEAECNA